MQGVQAVQHGRARRPQSTAERSGLQRSGHKEKRGLMAASATETDCLSVCLSVCLWEGAWGALWRAQPLCCCLEGTKTNRLLFGTACTQDGQAALPDQRVRTAVRGGARVLGPGLQPGGALLLEHVQHPPRHPGEFADPDLPCTLSERLS